MKLILTILFTAFCTLLQAQSQGLEPLPEFTVQQLGPNKVLIAWKNPHTNITQLMVQRSADSIRNYRTIFNAESPQLPENGFTDNNTIGARWYYRISYMLEGGKYYSTVSKSAGKQVATTRTSPRLRYADSLTRPPATLATDDGLIIVRQADTVLASLTSAAFARFKDSILTRSSDTLFALHADEYLLKPYKAPEQFRQSIHLFVNKDNFIQLKLPETRTYTYRLVIYDPATNEPMMELKELKEDELYIDKANFIHAGSYYFELYRAGKIFEKNRLYLRKDF